ncbi:MAG: hypothetical protein HY823_10580 [Acidobacteria bacterium]|nr:hypothetical protein [Acidobacteriota bacterium]
MARPDLSAAEQVLQNLKPAKKETAAEAPAPKSHKPEAAPLPKGKLKSGNTAHPSGFKHTRTSPRGK